MTEAEDKNDSQSTDLVTELESKPWYESKTIWVNAVLMLAMLVQHKYGFPIAPEIQAMIVSIVNVWLRKITKKPIKW